MAKIKIDDIVDNLSSFSLDFYFLKISGNVELEARNIFLALNEFSKYYESIYEKILKVIDSDEKEKINNLIEKNDNDEFQNFFTEIQRKYNINHHQCVLELGEKIFSGECKYILLLLNNLINKAITNSTFELYIYDKTEIENYIHLDEKLIGYIHNEIKQGSIINLLNVISNCYKKHYLNIFNSLTQSVIDFLVAIK